MRIGIDLDGVVFDSEKDFRVYSELYDIFDLKRNSKIDNTKLKFQDRFNWTKEETERFIDEYLIKVISECVVMPGAKQVLELLKQDGHELIVITARGGFDEHAIKITEDRLTEENLNIFDKYYWAVKNKGDICIQENIDIMIDDFIENCECVANNNIKSIYLKDAPSENINENEYIKVLYNWGEIYRYIKDLSN